jgi:glycosyltransferase involved in cell wall biosynthesis
MNTHTANSKIRVLMVCPKLPTADVPGSMAPTARQIDSLRDFGVETTTHDMQGIPKLKYLQAIPRIWQLSRSVDLVHAHFGYCGWLAQVAWRRPLVISFMGDDLLGTPINERGDLERLSRVMVQANRRLAHRADAVIVKSREMAQVLAPTVATVIPNGVDLDIFRPLDRREAREVLDLPQDRKLVLFPGNPANPRKGYSLARAAVDLAAKQLGATVELVPLWGVAPDDVPRMMNACEVMLMTSLIEGSPNVVKEGMACNLPVVGVPVGDVHELLEDVSGCVPCQRNADEIAHHLVRLLTTTISCAGREAIVARQLDLPGVARRVRAIYDNVLAGGRSTKVNQVSGPNSDSP